MASLQLHILLSWQSDHRVHVKTSPFTIGRHHVNDLRIESDPQVSRRHAQLVCEDETWYVVDLDSHWGTYLNEKRVDRAVVRSGDRLRIGARELQLVVGSIA